MLLAIDAGNTNLVFALVDGGEIKARWRIATDPRRTADQYAVWLHQLLELEGLQPRAKSTRVIIGTVVPRALHNLEVLRSKYFHVEPLIAGQGAAAWPIAARRRRAAECRRRPRAQCHRRPRQASGRPDRHRFRHRDDFRRGRVRRRLQGRDHRAGHQPVARCAGQRRRQAAAHRDRGAATTTASSAEPPKARC